MYHFFWLLWLGFFVSNLSFPNSSQSFSALDFFFSFGLLRATPVAYGGSQARGQIGAIAAGLHHSQVTGNQATGNSSALDF